jgi:hypothetical protein
MNFSWIAIDYEWLGLSQSNCFLHIPEQSYIASCAETSMHQKMAFNYSNFDNKSSTHLCWDK